MYQAAEALSTGNGAILMLTDPVAVAMEISALTRYRLNRAAEADPELKRGMALTTMLSGIELAMLTRFVQEAEASDSRAELRMRVGWDSPAGRHFPAPAIADRLYTLSEASRDARVDLP